MSSEEMQDLESILLAYTKDRFDMSSKGGILGSFANKFAGSLINELEKRLVLAFVRALYNVDGEMYLRDITAAVVSEAGYMMGVSPIFLAKTTSVKAEQLFTGDSIVRYQSEFHHWLIYLAEKGKLPGRYERFIGKWELSIAKPIPPGTSN